jgi:hypothetical protein
LPDRFILSILLFITSMDEAGLAYPEQIAFTLRISISIKIDGKRGWLIPCQPLP